MYRVSQTLLVMLMFGSGGTSLYPWRSEHVMFELVLNHAMIQKSAR